MLIILAIIATLSVGSTIAILGQAKFGAIPEGSRQVRIEMSPHYRQGQFVNKENTTLYAEGESPSKSMYDFFFKKKERNIPQDSIPGIHTDLKSLPLSEDALIWFGHSSFMLILDGKRILVDPVFSDHASPFAGMIKAFPGSNRYDASDMPPIDILIITHDHWDHLDYPTVSALQANVKTVFCGLGVGATLELWGYAKEQIHEMDWGDTLAYDSTLSITAHTARHFSGRSLRSNRTLWASYTLKTTDYKVYISGDGGYGAHFSEIGNQYGPYDLAILENGQYNKSWRNIHTMPEELTQEVEDLKAKRVMTVHNAKFPLSNHPWDEPLILAYQNFAKAEIPLLTPMIGERVDLRNPNQKFSLWWMNIH